MVFSNKKKVLALLVGTLFAKTLYAIDLASAPNDPIEMDDTEEKLSTQAVPKKEEGLAADELLRRIENLPQSAFEKQGDLNTSVADFARKDRYWSDRKGNRILLE